MFKIKNVKDFAKAVNKKNVMLSLVSYDLKVFCSDKNRLKILNETLETDYVAMFRDQWMIEQEYNSTSEVNNLSLDTETIYIVTKSGKVIEIIDSEWLSIKGFN